MPEDKPKKSAQLDYSKSRKVSQAEIEKLKSQGYVQGKDPVTGGDVWYKQGANVKEGKPSGSKRIIAPPVKKPISTGVTKPVRPIKSSNIKKPLPEESQWQDIVYTDPVKTETTDVAANLDVGAAGGERRDYVTDDVYSISYPDTKGGGGYSKATKKFFDISGKELDTGGKEDLTSMYVDGKYTPKFVPGMTQASAINTPQGQGSMLLTGEATNANTLEEQLLNSKNPVLRRGTDQMSSVPGVNAGPLIDKSSQGIGVGLMDKSKLPTVTLPKEEDVLKAKFNRGGKITKAPCMNKGGKIKKMAVGGWVDAEGNPISEADMALSDEDKLAQGWKQVGGEDSSMLSTATDTLGKNAEGAEGGIGAETPGGSKASKIATMAAPFLSAGGSKIVDANKDEEGRSKGYAGSIGGNALSYAGKGAALGAKIPIPGGVFIGAGLGAVYGGIKGAKQTNEDVKARLNQFTEESTLAGNEAVALRDTGATNVTTKSDVDLKQLDKDKKKGIFGLQGSFLAKGGKIVGPGSGISDSIKNVKLEGGGFVVPAKNEDKAAAIRKLILKQAPSLKTKSNLNKGDVKAHVSNGEHYFTEDEVNEIEGQLGDDVLDKLAPDAEMNKGGRLSAEKASIMLHEGKFDSDKQRRYFGWVAGGRKMNHGGKVKGYAPGGNVDETPKQRTERLKKEDADKKAPAKSSVKSAPKVGKQKSKSLEEIVKFTPPIDESKYSVPVSKVPLAKQTADELALVESAQKAEKEYVAPPPPKGIKDILNVDTAIQYGIPLFQAGMGISNLLKQGKRPIDKMDPAYNASVEKALGDAKFGFSPEERFALDQQNQNLTNAARFSARNLSGGSAASALNSERRAINESFGRGLMTTIAGQDKQREKQMYADQKVADRAEKSRRLFGDTMSAWQQQQAANSELTSVGLQNLIGASRYKAEQEAQKKINSSRNSYLNSF